MRIQLEEPFASIWEYGYLRIDNTDQRKKVDLISNNKNIGRTTISYARYLICVKLGYILSSEYEVDHKDDDKTNDDINNLQILTSEQNRLKQQYNYIMNEQVVYGFHCANCGMPFLLIERRVKMRLAQNVELAFCSKSCGVSHYFYTKRKNKENEDLIIVS